MILAVADDLFFQARISSAARAAGHSVQYISREGEIPAGSEVALVDLDAKNVLPLIGALRQSGHPVIAFGPHVDTDRRKAARAAGARRVLAKSKFVQDLPEIVRSG
ncbi:MAG: hypothetical protein ACRDFS_01975 [Chloroflexota bacterium]